MMAKLKTIFKKFGYFLIVIVIIGVGFLIWQNMTEIKSCLNKLKSGNTKISINKVLPVGEYSVLEYHYSALLNFKEPMRLLGLIPIPLPFDLGYKKLFFKIDGIIELGFDFKDVEIEITSYNIILHMPKIEITSHDMDIDKGFELYGIRAEWVFNHLSSKDYYQLRAKLKQESEEKIKIDVNINKQAKESAENQLSMFIENLPNIKDKYKIAFKWDL
jgi:hypothetical protein